MHTCVWLFRDNLIINSNCLHGKLKSSPGITFRINYPLPIFLAYLSCASKRHIAGLSIDQMEISDMIPHIEA